MLPAEPRVALIAARCRITTLLLRHLLARKGIESRAVGDCQAAGVALRTGDVGLLVVDEALVGKDEAWADLASRSNVDLVVLRDPAAPPNDRNRSMSTADLEALNLPVGATSVARLVDRLTRPRAHCSRAHCSRAHCSRVH